MKIFKNKYVSFLIKVSILLILLYTTYRQVYTHQGDISSIVSIDWTIKTFLLLALTCILMFLNWFIEAVKWKRLMLKNEPLSILNAIKGIFAGVTLSLFTPNRIGEYGGRILFVEKENRAAAIETSILCSLSQQIVIVFVGLLAVIAFGYFNSQLPYSYAIFSLSLCYLIFIITVYFNIEFIKKYFGKFKSIQNWLKPILKGKKYTYQSLKRTLIFSFIRYFVFCSQLLLLFYFFGVEISSGIAYITIAVLFLFQTLIPSVALIEIGIRGNIAVYLFKLLDIYSFGIVNAILLIWIINLLIPALIGWLIILKTKFSEQN